jgi:RND family efflux transporter MFP subunit
MRTTLCLIWLGLWMALGLVCGQENTPHRVSGITEPVLDGILNSPLDGIVSRVWFKEGDFVEEGKVLLELDKSLQELEVARRKVVAETRRSELDRLQKLFDRTGSVSEEQLEKKRLEYQEAAAELALAEDLLRKRLIVAPFSGYIVDLYRREPGEGCRQNETPLVRLVDTRRARLVCTMEAKLGYRLKPGQQLPLEIEAGDKPARLEGTIEFVSPVVDAASGLLTVKIVFDNVDGRIRPGVAGVLLLTE